MNIGNQKIFAAVFCSVCFIACGGSQVGVTEEAPRYSVSGDAVYIDTMKSYPPLQIEDLRTFTLAPTPFYEPHNRVHELYVPKPLKTFDDSEVAADKPLEERPGFRVQVIAVDDQHRARLIESRVRDILQDQHHQIYMDYDAPQYKVRVGDFTMREEAVQLGEWLRQQGFYDSWVVRSKVFPARNIPIEAEIEPAEVDPVEP